jgi:hypothetical protein
VRSFSIGRPEPRGAVLTRDIRPSGLSRKNKKAPRASLSFMRTRDRARSLHGIRGYF